MGKQKNPKLTPSEKKLLLAFEFGFMFRDVASELKLKLEKEIIEDAEKILLNEFKERTLTQLSIEMVPIILSMLQPKN